MPQIMVVDDEELVRFTLRQALEKGGLKTPGGAYLLIGISANEMRDFTQALDALKEARNYDDKTRRQAGDWIKFVEERQQAAAAG